VDPISSLRRRERVIAIVRWVAVGFAALQTLLYVPPPSADEAAAAAATTLALGLVGLLAAVGIVVEVVLRTVEDPRRLVRIGAGVLVADCAVTLGFVWAYAFDPVSAQWSMLTVLPLEGALRFRLRGALAVWAAIVPAYVLRDLFANRVHEVAVALGAVSYRLGLLLVVALFAGFMARDLDDQRRVLQRLSGAQKELASHRDPAGILQTLCRQTVGCLGRGSAIVYADDGQWMQAVASWPADDLPAVVAQDQDEDEDQALRAQVVAGPVWLAADARRPHRLAVPLRWRDEPVRHVLVYRPDHRGSPEFHVEVAISLAESAALALATSRLILTEQRTARRLHRLEALRTRFVATVAHDLRRPLTVFKGVSQLLRDRRDSISPDQVDAMLATVERQANRLNRLADDLLDAARVDADRLTLHLAECDLTAVVQATLADSEEDIRVEMPPSLRLRGDAPRLERVVWNLLSNAEKYGKPPFEVRVRAEEGWAVLDVRDHGTGLDAGQKARLFTEFAGSDDAASVGLGLAIVWELVSAHGGNVEYVDGDPGARFVVRLPVAGPHDEQPSPTVASTPSG
jgi:signal transduction histidine kinase